MRLLSNSMTQWAGAATILACWAPLLAATEPQLSQRVDDVFADLDRTDSPGCTVGVVQDGRVIYQRGYGMASLELGVPNSAQLVYYAGSVSKQFVAASIVLAAQQGKLGLDDDIRLHLPEIPDYGHKITIRQMVHHTSGLRDYLGLMDLAGMRHEDVHSDEEALQLVARQKELNFRPGDEHLYSNTGYFLLSEIIERATGQTLREFAAANIFEPLGMVHSHFHDDRKKVVPGRAAAYSRSKTGVFELDWFLNFDKVGSGGLMTTIEDLALWDRNFYDNRLGRKGFLEQMHEKGRLNDGTELDYAFGLGVGGYRGLKRVSHNGAMMGFRSAFLQFPGERFSAIALCNLADANPGNRVEKVADIYLADRFSRPAPEPEDDEPESAAKASAWKPSAEVLQRLAGTYRSDELAATYHFEQQAASLRFSGIGAIPPMSLQPVSTNVASGNVFTGSGMQFVFAADGSAFELHAGRVRNIRFARSR